jgi:predicted Rossmann-fold nucleotide-binding protein
VQPTRRRVEVETLAELDRRLAAGATSMAGWVLQALDLRERGDALRGLDVRGTLLLGCLLDPSVEDDLRSRGALLFPGVPDVPVDPYRSRLYTPDELYDGLATGPYEDTLDARAYAWAVQSVADVQAHLAQTLHDLSVDDALAELTRGRHVVGVMGGHAAGRGSETYRVAARLGRSLSRSGLTVATGGGPGAMEAANLGAYLAHHDEPVLDEAVELLARVPDFRPSVTAWARAAFGVRGRWPGADSLGVPTWFYGHEPPNAFAEHVAKYFKNAIREDILLHVCTAGVVFLPGRGGTVQEVFQEACENYYADAASVAPMVLVGVDYWTRELPVWPLLESLAAGRDMASAVHLVDDLESVLPLLAGQDGRDRSPAREGVAGSRYEPVLGDDRLRSGRGGRPQHDLGGADRP